MAENKEVLEVVLMLTDRYSGQLDEIVSRTKKAKEEFEKVKPVIEAKDKATGKIEKIRSLIKKIKDVKKNVDIKDKATSKIRKIRLEMFKIKAKTVAVTLKDKASRVASFIGKGIKSVARKWTAHIGLKDGASAVIGAIKKSIKGLIAVAVSAGVAIGKALKSAVVLEQQQITMRHFMGVGNPNKSGVQLDKMSSDYVKQLQSNANATPYSTNDVLSAGTRGLTISGGDPAQAMRLVKLAEDMAAADPNKTLGDAIEALADAQMGEFERMKEFGFKGSKEAFDKAGGDFFKMKGTDGRTVNQTFGGLAEKQANTTGGIVSTIGGNIGTGASQFGMGILDGMKPQLKDLSDWIKNNLGDEKSLNKFRKWGQNIGQGVEKVVGFFRDFGSGVKNILMDFGNGFMDWIKGDIFQAQMQGIGEAFQGFGDLVQNNAPVIQLLMGFFGQAFGLAATVIAFAVNMILTVVTGVFQAINWVLETCGKGIDKLKQGWESLKAKVTFAANATKQVATSAMNAIKSAIGWVVDKCNSLKNAWMELKHKIESNPIVQTISRVFNGGDEDGSHATGLNRVPFNGYHAKLHEGERILTRNEANLLDKGGMGSPNINITLNANISNEGDENRIIDKLVRQIKLAYP